MHMRNIKGEMTTKPRGISSYMKRYYFQVWIDGFQNKAFTVFIDAHHDDDAETKLLEKFKYTQQTKRSGLNEYKIWIDQFEEKSRIVSINANESILAKFRCRNFNKTSKV